MSVKKEMRESTEAGTRRYIKKLVDEHYKDLTPAQREGDVLAELERARDRSRAAEAERREAALRELADLLEGLPEDFERWGERKRREGVQEAVAVVDYIGHAAWGTEWTQAELEGAVADYYRELGEKLEMGGNGHG